MNQGKLNFRDLLEDSTDCLLTNLNQQRQWQTTSTGVRKYHDLATTLNDKENLTQQLLKNLANTKRNVSELIEKNKMAQWLKKNTIKCESKSGYDLNGFSGDSGVSLCTLSDESKDWSSYQPVENVKDDGKKHCARFNQINQSMSKINLDESSDILCRPNRSSNYDIKEYYTPRSSWDENKHPDLINKPKYCQEDIASLFKPSETNEVERVSNMISLIPSPGFESRPNSSSQNSDGTESTLMNVDKSFDEPERPYRFERINIDNISDSNLTSSNTSLVEVKREINLNGTTSIYNKQESNHSFPEQFPGIAKSLIHLTQLKNSNKNAVANFLNTLTGCQNEKKSTERLSNDNKESGSGYVSSNISSDEITLNTSSNESLKWNFPNSNRKREEKLRSIGKEITISDISSKESNKSFIFDDSKTISNDTQSRNDSTTSISLTDSPSLSSCGRKQSKTEFKISYSAQGCIKKVYDETNQCSYKTVAKTKATNLTNSICQAENHNVQNVREMNTQAALIYLSETLIESAQRAEMLLMQKMKEYNDLVCREPPEKKKQDFSCQMKVEEQHFETAFQDKLKDLKFKYEIELKEKSEKIVRLETEKKKLRQALKKSNYSVVKKCVGTTSDNIDKEVEELTPRSVNSEFSRMNDMTTPHPDFVQALKIENNLLHTLLKEMKAELDQENATILSLAKKLEMSLGKQTVSKSKQQTDVVRKLETKLEQQEKMLKQEAMEARAVAKYVIMKYKKLIHEYKQKVKSHQDTVDKLTNAIK